MTERAVPVLPSRDLRVSLAFYERLGFENRGAPPEEWNYLIVGRGDIELHVIGTPDVDPPNGSARCYLFVDDAQALHDEWASAIEPDAGGAGRLVAPEDTDYGMREFDVVDPSGNVVRVGSSLRP